MITNVLILKLVIITLFDFGRAGLWSWMILIPFAPGFSLKTKSTGNMIWCLVRYLDSNFIQFMIIKIFFQKRIQYLLEVQLLELTSSPNMVISNFKLEYLEELLRDQDMMCGLVLDNFHVNKISPDFLYAIPCLLYTSPSPRD